METGGASGPTPPRGPLPPEGTGKPRGTEETTPSDSQGSVSADKVELQANAPGAPIRPEQQSDRDKEWDVDVSRALEALEGLAKTRPKSAPGGSGA